ncbi:redoxin domain-containing protein [bacterium]|nr:redoxin domain-containing protein [bacterium]
MRAIRSLSRGTALVGAFTLAVSLSLAARADDAKKDEKPEEKKTEKVSLKTGDAAPDFKVKDQDGKEVKLADLKKKRFVLWFFPKCATPG